MTTRTDESRVAAEPAAQPSLILEKRGGVCTLTLNRPAKRNAIDWATWERLDATLNDVATDREVRILVLTGAGGSFCAGNDLTSPPPALHPISQMEIVNRVALALHRLPKISIARVDGDAVGAGCNLALACDLIVASDRSRFAEIFVRRGLSVDFGASWILPRLVGLHRAKEFCLTGELIDALTAAEIGLIARCVPASSLDETVDDLIHRLLEGAPVAQVLTKRLLNEGSLSTFEQALDHEAAAQVVNVGSRDFGEAREAFVGRRPPLFDGGWGPAV
jgi:enoyl-CoA hydratase/carnithine racemase